jgi:hypothetical protein
MGILPPNLFPVRHGQANESGLTPDSGTQIALTAGPSTTLRSGRDDKFVLKSMISHDNCPSCNKIVIPTGAHPDFLPRCTGENRLVQRYMAGNPGFGAGSATASSHADTEGRPLQQNHMVSSPWMSRRLMRTRLKPCPFAQRYGGNT